MTKPENFYPKDGLMRLPVHIIEDIFKNGYAFITLLNGESKKITLEDLVFKKSEIEQFEKTEKFKEFKRDCELKNKIEKKEFSENE